MVERMISVHHRIEDGAVIRSPAINFARVSPAKTGRGHHSAGSGLFSTAEDWGVIMSTVMNGGLCHATSKRIIQAETLENMFTPQLGAQHLPPLLLEAARKDFIHPTSYSDFDLGDVHKNFGLGMILVGGKEGTKSTEGVRGLTQGSGWWLGTGALYWIDRTTGVSG